MEAVACQMGPCLDVCPPTGGLNPLGNPPPPRLWRTNWDDTVLDSVTETRTHNAVNELTARTVGEDPQISLAYDSAGNLTQDGDSNGDHKYTWDYRNRLIEVEEKQSGNWNTTGEYKYDAQGRRILKTVTNKGGLNGTTRFLWGGSGDPSTALGAGWQCLEERDGSGDLVARFTYAPDYIDAVAVQERDLNSDDDFGDANEVVYYHQNTLFAAYALSDGNESVIERYRYDAYGACTVLDADGSADADGLSDVGNPYRFTGRRLDPESGLMQYRNRYYHTGLGRFISPDPEGYTSGYGQYPYGESHPCNTVDPLGLWPCTSNCGPEGLREGKVHGHKKKRLLGQWDQGFLDEVTRRYEKFHFVLKVASVISAAPGLHEGGAEAAGQIVDYWIDVNMGPDEDAMVAAVQKIEEIMVESQGIFELHVQVSCRECKRKKCLWGLLGECLQWEVTREPEWYRCNNSPSHGYPSYWFQRNDESLGLLIVQCAQQAVRELCDPYNPAIPKDIPPGGNAQGPPQEG